MGATFKSYTGASQSGSANMTHVLPTGIVAGDLLVLVINSDSSTQGVAVSGGSANAWTRVVDSGSSQQGFWVGVLWKWATAADSGATITLSSLNGNAQNVITAVYQNAVPVSGVAGTTPVRRAKLTTNIANASPGTTTPAIAVDATGELVIQGAGARDVSDGFVSWSVYPTTLRRQQRGSYYSAGLLTDQNAAAAGNHGGFAFQHSGDTNGGEVMTLVVAGNTPPNAPSLVAPTSSSAVLDVANVNRFSWTHSDPDGQSQSAYDLRYRKVGAATWTTVSGTSPNMYHDLAAGSLTAGDYEWQARTADTLGSYGPFSSSAFFTAAAAPATPTITAPVNGANVDYQATVTWSAAQQDAYQLQVLTGDAATVLEDSGVVEQAATRSRDVSFPANGVTRTIRVRVRYGGLWSSWYSIQVTVSYTPPAVPTIVQQAQGTALLVTVTNPVPTGTQPTVTSNEIFVADPGQAEQLRAVVGANASWTYWLPASGVDYATRVRVEAVGANGTRSSS